MLCTHIMPTNIADKSLHNSAVSIIMSVIITRVSPLVKFIPLCLLCALLFSIVSSSIPQSKSNSEYEHEHEPEPTIKYDENNHAKLKSDESPETFLFKIRYGKTLKRLNVPIYDGNLHYNMDELRGRITNIFGLPRDSKLEISYIDEDGELISMTHENDLMNITTQKKLQNRLRMYVKLINNETATPAAVQAGLDPVGASESGSLDDFFIYELL